MNLKDYERPSVTTDIVLFRINKQESKNTRRVEKTELQVLLLVRDKEIDKGLYSLPGGFVDINETLDDNVIRKLLEKTGVSGDFYLEQLYTWGAVNRDIRGRVISVSYLGLCNTDNLKSTNSVNEVQWLNVEDVLDNKYGNLAFDHKEIITYALDRLKNKVEYTDIAFNLLPSVFTINECQSVYELLLQHPILNFRRKIDDYVEMTGKLMDTKGRQYRTPQAYRLKKNRKSKF